MSQVGMPTETSPSTIRSSTLRAAGPATASWYTETHSTQAQQMISAATNPMGAPARRFASTAPNAIVGWFGSKHPSASPPPAREATNEHSIAIAARRPSGSHSAANWMQGVAGAAAAARSPRTSRRGAGEEGNGARIPAGRHSGHAPRTDVLDVDGVGKDGGPSTRRHRSLPRATRLTGSSARRRRQGRLGITLNLRYRRVAKSR